jgi:endonuclease/exonuclease/phosphatase family metal-dependent hydrolase
MRWLKIILYLIAGMGILFLLFLGQATIRDYRPGTEESAQISGNAPELTAKDSVFTITTWNLGYFGLGKECDFFFDGGKMTRPSKEEYVNYSEGVIKYIENKEKSDFYFFQEVDVNAKRSYSDDQVDRLRQIFQGMESSFALNYVVPFVIVPVTNPMGKVKSGILTFSSFKTSMNNRYAFPTGYTWPVNLFQLDRCFMLSRIPMPDGRQLVLINTHNEAFDDGSQRKKQLAVLKDLMLAEYEKGNYVVTGGDWNQNPVGFGDWAIWRLGDLTIGRLGDWTIGRFSNDDVGRKIEPAIEPDFFPDDWQWVFDPELPTNRDVLAPYEKGVTKTTIIDFFVVSPNVEVLKVETDDLGFAWSDHQPVRMTFRLGNNC